MNRPAPNRMTSVVVSPDAKTRIEALAQERFGPRGMAYWLEEQLSALLSDRNFLIRCAQAETAPKGVAKSLTLTARAQGYLDEGVRRLVMIDPLRKGSRSNILRAAFQLAFERADEALLSKGKDRKEADDPVAPSAESLADIEIPLKVQPSRLIKPGRKKEQKPASKTAR